MDKQEFKSINKGLRIVHFPQLGSKVEITIDVPYYEGEIIERKAYEILTILSLHHIKLYEKGIIPDFANSMIVEMFDEESNGWVDYFNEEMGMDWFDIENYFDDKVTIKVK